MALNINKREKIALTAAVCAILVFILLQFLVFPLFDKKERLTQMLSTRQQELAKILQLQADYRQTTQKITQAQRFLKARKPGFTLFSFLETLAGQTGVKSHIAYMRPNTTSVKDSPYRLSMVEMKLQEITMSQLLGYLHGIETSRNMISVKRLSVAKGERKADLINAVFQVQTLEQ